MACPLVALFVFNRPESTRRVLQRLREVRLTRLAIIADGPRLANTADNGRVLEVRNIIENEIDWPCEVLHHYSDVNLGCRGRVSSGLSWVFQQVDKAIILEDDTLPDSTFFPFCEEMLDRYRNDNQVVHISGNNPLSERHTLNGFYGFTKYPFIWGWATWRRAWKQYRVDCEGHADFVRSREFQRLCPTSLERGFWRYNFRMAGSGAMNTWDYQWIYACWRQGGLSIVPRENLIENIGFGPDGTHTTEANWRARQKAQPFPPPYAAPPAVAADAEYDRIAFDEVFEGQSLHQYRTLRFRLRVGWSRLRAWAARFRAGA